MSGAKVALYIQQMLGSSITEPGNVSVPRTRCSERNPERKPEGVYGSKWEKDALQAGVNEETIGWTREQLASSTASGNLTGSSLNLPDV